MNFTDLLWLDADESQHRRHETQRKTNSGEKDRASLKPENSSPRLHLYAARPAPTDLSSRSVRTTEQTSANRQLDTDASGIPIWLLWRQKHNHRQYNRHADTVCWITYSRHVPRNMKTEYVLLCSQQHTN